MGEGNSAFNPGDMGFNELEQSGQHAERERRKRAALARLVLARRARLFQEGWESGDASAEPGGSVQDLWSSMPQAGREFQAELAGDDRVTGEMTGGDEDPLDFSDLPVF